MYPLCFGYAPGVLAERYMPPAEKCRTAFLSCAAEGHPRRFAVKKRMSVAGGRQSALKKCTRKTAEKLVD